MMQLLIQTNIFVFFPFLSIESIFLLLLLVCFKNNDLLLRNLTDQKFIQEMELYTF